MADRVLQTAHGRFELERHPPRPRQQLRAWDAADELVLTHLADRAIEPGRIAIVNDSFGALGVSLARHRPVVVSDSHNSDLALGRNLDANGFGPVETMTSLELAGDPFDTIVMKVPRSGGQLEDQLHRLRPLMTGRTRLVAAAMSRRIHTSTLELFESILGPTTTSKATKKARLIHCSLDPRLRPPPNPWPIRWVYEELTIVSHGGVFSADRLDRGTRLLLAQIPGVESPTTAVDLGCGNGVVGLELARRSEVVELTFVDESYRAIESSRAGWRENMGDRPARFLPSDRLVNVVDRGTVDLIVTNPPFHEDRAMGDATAWDFFIDSHAILRRGGTVLAVGNRHVAHHAKLSKIFGQVDVVASDPKYVVLRSDKT